MSTRFFVKAFTAAFAAEIKMVVRYVSFTGLLGFNLAVPFFYILTSWITAKIVTDVAGLAYFQAASGVSDYLSFVTIGFAFNTFIFSAAFGGAHAIRGEQEHGTAELVFLTPASKIAWLLGKMTGGQVFSLIGFSTMLVSGSLVFGYRPQASPDVLVAFIGVILTMASLSAFGFFFAGVCFFAKREEELSQVLWPFMVFFCGLAFPIEVLPVWGQAVSWMIPLTYGIDVTRRALLQGLGLFDSLILSRIGMLLIQTVVLLPLGLFLFARLSKKARQTGALATY